MPRSVRLASSLVVSAAFVLLSSPASASPGDYSIVQTLISPHPSPDGLGFDGESLWISDCQSTTVFLVNPTTGEKVTSYKFPFMVDHLEWRGAYLWMSDHTNFYKIDSADKQVKETIAGGWKNLMGVTEQDGSLWSLQPDSKLIHKVDPKSGEILATIPSPGGNPCGIAWDGRCLWVSDLTDQVFYQIDPKDGAKVLTLDSPGGAKRLPTGVAFAGRRMWVADEDPSDPKIYELNVEYLDSGKCAFPADEPDAGAIEAGEELAEPDADTAAAAAAEDSSGSSGGCSAAPLGSSTGVGGLLSLVALALLRKRTAS